MTSPSELILHRTDRGHTRIGHQYEDATCKNGLQVRSEGIRSVSLERTELGKLKSLTFCLHSPARRITSNSANPPGLCRKTCSLSAGLLFCVARGPSSEATL